MSYLFGYASVLLRLQDIDFSFLTPTRRYGPGRKANVIKTGKVYPHSSTRQRAHYARQIAAGQLKMAGTP
jgi:hypothetical protein